MFLMFDKTGFLRFNDIVAVVERSVDYQNRILVDSCIEIRIQGGWAGAEFDKLQRVKKRAIT